MLLWIGKGTVWILSVAGHFETAPVAKRGWKKTRQCLPETLKCDEEASQSEAEHFNVPFDVLFRSLTVYTAALHLHFHACGSKHRFGRSSPWRQSFSVTVSVVHVAVIHQGADLESFAVKYQLFTFFTFGILTETPPIFRWPRPQLQEKWNLARIEQQNSIKVNDMSGTKHWHPRFPNVLVVSVTTAETGYTLCLSPNLYTLFLYLHFSSVKISEHQVFHVTYYCRIVFQIKDVMFTSF